MKITLPGPYQFSHASKEELNRAIVNMETRYAKHIIFPRSESAQVETVKPFVIEVVPEKTVEVKNEEKLELVTYNDMFIEALSVLEQNRGKTKEHLMKDYLLGE